jgi:GNAT superfamily N-acetyltransferase
MEALVVRLRPFEEGDLWYFDRDAKDRDFSAPFEWSVFKSAESWRRRWREDGLLGSSPSFLVVAAADDDSLVGVVDWRQNQRPGAGVWEIGVLIMPEYRGRGAGTEAQLANLSTTCSRRRRAIAFGLAPRWRTSPSSVPSNGPVFAARDAYGVTISATANGGTVTYTASRATTGQGDRLPPW